MKTQKQVQKDIDTLMEVGNKTSDTKEKNRIRKRLQFLRPIRFYMDNDPTEESVSSQLRHCLKKIDVINREFEATHPSYCDAKTKREWMKGKGLPELKKQVKVLQYLLGSE